MTAKKYIIQYACADEALRPEGYNYTYEDNSSSWKSAAEGYTLKEVIDDFITVCNDEAISIENNWLRLKIENVKGEGTGIKKPTEKDGWRELCVGDKIKCHICDYSLSHNYLSMEGEIIWDKDRAQYSIKGKYTNNNYNTLKAIFPIHQIVNKKITFIDN